MECPSYIYMIYSLIYSNHLLQSHLLGERQKPDSPHSSKHVSPNINYTCVLELGQAKGRNKPWKAGLGSCPSALHVSINPRALCDNSKPSVKCLLNGWMTEWASRLELFIKSLITSCPVSIFYSVFSNHFAMTLQQSSSRKITFGYWQ